MLKTLLIFFFWLFVFNITQAQTTDKKPDTLVCFLKYSTEIVSTRDSADYILSFPAKPGSDGLYTINEYYPNGSSKLIGQCIKSPLTTQLTPVFEGQYVEFFKNGNRKKIATCYNGTQMGDVTEYYPNGKLYLRLNIDAGKRPHNNVDKIKTTMVECRYPTGNVLASNGNGECIIFDEDFKYIEKEGPVVNGLADGEWHGRLGDTLKYTCIYRKGQLVSGTGYDNTGKAYPFKQTIVPAAYKYGMDYFYAFLANAIKYPAIALKNKTQGQVLISFDVEKNGTLTNFKAIRPVSPELYNEAVRVIKLSSPWIPRVAYGIITSQSCTIPVSFYPN